MRFRTALLLAMLLLVGGVVASVVVSVSRVLDQTARKEVDADIVRAERVLTQLLESRQALHRSQTRVVSEEPRLKAVVATQDITHETVFGVARDLARSADADVFLLGGPDGRLLADVNLPGESGHDLSHMPLIATALKEGEADGVWVDASRAYQVHARRLAFGTTTVGVLVMGYAFSEDLVDKLVEQTGVSGVIALDDQVLATSLEGVEDRVTLVAMGQAGGTDPQVLLLGDMTYMGIVGPVPGYKGEARLRFSVLRSLDEALAPGRALIRVLYGIAAVALLICAVLALFLSSRLSRPLDGLVKLTESVGAGDLSARAPVQGLYETRLLGVALNRMVGELEQSREKLAHQERLEREMEIASQLQTSMLPRDIKADRMDIAAQMIPATEVGGDYYDVIPLPDGPSWIGIGDVAGHGMPAGVVMLMIQTGVASILAENPKIKPRDLVSKLNTVMYENIRQRLDSDEHVTFCMLHHDGQGGITHAGAHEDIVVFRKATGKCELIHTHGTWMGFQSDISALINDQRFSLNAGDIMVLFTDGITEAMNADGEQFGIERTMAAIEAKGAGGSATAVRDEIVSRVQEWLVDQDDDVTLLVARYAGEGA